MRTYKPKNIITPPKLINVESAWKGLEGIIGDIVDRFEIKRESCIEFGVEYGFSTVALSNYFDKVVGIDTFMGDIDSGMKSDHFTETRSSLEPFRNIELVQSNYIDFILSHQEKYNLSHVDIVHTYEDTYRCGEWCCEHSDIVLFHDTLSHENVRRAVLDLSKKYPFKFYNYPKHYGLGILAKRRKKHWLF